MPPVRFKRAVEGIGGQILGPQGFAYAEETLGFHTFRRPGKPGFLEGIILYLGRPMPPPQSPQDPRQGPRGFTVEVSLVPETTRRFGFSLPFESGNWRELGLRERLGRILHGEDYDRDPIDRDFFFYSDQRSLEAQLRKTLGLALEHGPHVWRHMTERLMSAEALSEEG